MSSVNPVSKNINNINFFSNPSACINDFQNKSWISRFKSHVSSYGTLLAYTISKIKMTFSNVQQKMEPYTALKINDSANQNLVVCLHGLNNNPTQFSHFVDEMTIQGNSQFKIFIPEIMDKGNAKLDDMVAPILKNILAWSKNAKGKELVLVGISNGGRIARTLEAELMSSGQLNKIKKIRFISIVGATNGSSLASLAKKLHLSCFMSKNIAEEMPVNSERFKKLNKKCDIINLVRKPARDYTFIASPHDWQVPNYNSTLLDIKHANAKYAIVPNHGHNSIVNAVSKTVASIILQNT